MEAYELQIICHQWLPAAHYRPFFEMYLKIKLWQIPSSSTTAIFANLFRQVGIISTSWNHFPKLESFPQVGIISPSWNHFPKLESFPQVGIISPSWNHFPKLESFPQVGIISPSINITGEQLVAEGG
ncbi:hypothetical protein AVEN_13239-1 [Araneus ventricosus]|uniref:Uncharacterized protein n=1 Tax=Araneus ventricosus TaxID=182803 RepID=A0A4Y2DMG1_ARAVE|nr:hypothetical protein AVEN_13239-1 [Araneus ventricosus]